MLGRAYVNISLSRELVKHVVPHCPPPKLPPPPQDSMELVFKQSKAVAVTSMSFPLGDVNNFVVGSEDGSVYMSCRHGRWVPPKHGQETEAGF